MRRKYPRQALSLAAALVLGGCWEKLTLGEFVDTETANSNETEVDVTADNPCNEVQCNTPPTDICDNEEKGEMTRYARNGWCEVVDNAPLCRYATYKDTCLSGPCTTASGCTDTPLQATYCFARESATCANDTLRVPYPHGVATETGCVYTAQTVVCDNGCNGDKNGCRDDPCAGRVCNDPPARFCQDNLLVVWSSQGRCAQTGECTYTKRTVSCDKGCQEGRCNDESRCAHTVCNAPPANFCLDAHTLFGYTPRGACDEGACTYSGETITCTSGCENGHCLNDPCLGTACVFPFAPACTPDGDLRIWDGGWDDNPLAPACIDGVCQYGTFNSDMTICSRHDCIDGRCRSEPCAGFPIYCNEVNVPADFCDAEASIQYDAAQTCEGNGFCGYLQTNTPCDGACQRGRCVNDPIADVK